MLYDLFPDCRLSYTFSGNTIGDLVENLKNQYGERIKESIWDRSIQGLDQTVQIMVNRKFVSSEDFDHQEIKVGDKVIFLRLLAGG